MIGHIAAEYTLLFSGYMGKYRRLSVMCYTIFLKSLHGSCCCAEIGCLTREQLLPVTEIKKNIPCSSQVKLQLVLLSIYGYFVLQVFMTLIFSLEKLATQSNSDTARVLVVQSAKSL